MSVSRERRSSDVARCQIGYSGAGLAVEERRRAGIFQSGADPTTRLETRMQLFINGERRTYDGDAAMPLLWYLRDELGLTGTKFGCGIGACGACTVHLDGTAVRSCSTPMQVLDGKHVVTIEGLDKEGNHPVQVAWRAANVPQCGYCQSGQIMQAVALLETTPHPTDDEIDRAMQGNICRCGTYQRIRAAIHAAAQGGA
jgi:isoquinoline 1-oxidoreductase alpha subunit